MNLGIGVSSIVGQAVFVPITVSDLAGKDVFSYQFDLIFDNTQILFQNASADGTVSAGFSVVSNLINENTVRIVAAGSDSIISQNPPDVLVKLEFTAGANASGSVFFDFVNVKMNEGEPPASGVPGSITFNTNFSPVISPPITAGGNVGQEFNFRVSAFDPEGDLPLTFAFLNTPKCFGVN